MQRDFYLKLAQRKLAMPIGADLVLHEREDAEEARLDGARLGEVIVEAARRYRTPLAFPLMDLQIEKEAMAYWKGSPGGARPTPRMRAAMEAIRHVSTQPDLVPMGMAIGPFSLLTKVIDDPITSIYLASHAEEGDEELELVEDTLEQATEVIARWITLQMEAGAKAICVCEPAANTVYLSPKQLEEDPGIFDRFVIAYNKRLSKLMADHGVDLVFHDCGELIPMMIEKFQQLEPAILSLGSPVKLWEAARHTRPETVLFGNLPSKKFYSDKEYPEEALREDARELRERMDATGHPYILGSECDVLTVRGCECAIRHKTRILLEC
jgi:uroporphyrinogen-III decarboxylase